MEVSQEMNQSEVFMMNVRQFLCFSAVMGVVICGGCAHQKVDGVSPDQATRIDRRLVKEAVTFGPGAEDGATIPDVSSPCLHAEVVPEHKEDGGRILVERHRRWQLQCDAQILSIPSSNRSK